LGEGDSGVIKRKTRELPQIQGKRKGGKMEVAIEKVMGKIKAIPKIDKGSRKRVKGINLGK